MVKKILKCVLLFLLYYPLLLFSLKGQGTIKGTIIITQDSIGEYKIIPDSILCILYKVNTPVDSIDEEFDGYWYKGTPWVLIIDSIRFIPIASAFPNKSGHFQFKGVDTGQYFIRAYFPTELDYQTKLFSNLKIKASEELNVQIEFPEYCQYYKNRWDSTCPKCKSKDLVLKITYGCEIWSDYSIKNGKAEGIYVPSHNLESGCDPHWYCTTDDIEF